MVRISEGVWERWRELAAEFTEPEIVLLFTSRLSHDEALEAIAGAASDAIRGLEAEAAAAGRDGASTGHWSLAPVRGGVAVRIDEEPEDFEELVRRIASGLERRGVDGAIDLYKPEPAAELADKIDLLECRLRVSGSRYHIRYRNYGWRADPGALETVVGGATDWVVQNAEGGHVQLDVRLLPPSTLEPDDDVHAYMRHALAVSAELGVVQLTSVGEERFRSVAVTASRGRVSLIEGGPPLHRGGWRATLRELVVQMEAASPRCVYGFVKRGSHRPVAQLGISLAEDWPPVPHFDPYSITAEAFEDRFAPDAFGVQLFGPGYAGRVPDGPRWKPVGAGTDAVVLEHVDLDAWFERSLVPFGGRRPHQPAQVPEVLAEARKDFAEILFTSAVPVSQ